MQIKSHTLCRCRRPESGHIQTDRFNLCQNNVLFFSAVFSSGRGKGRGRSRNEDDQEGAGGRPSGPSTLFDFLESKMGVFSIDGGLYSKLWNSVFFFFLIILEKRETKCKGHRCVQLPTQFLCSDDLWEGLWESTQVKAKVWLMFVAPFEASSLGGIY